MKTKKILNQSKPKVYVATPCYGDIKIETMVSLLDTFSTLGGSGIEAKFKTVKTSLVTHGRNLLTCGFMDSGFDYMLFVDADVEFKPEAVLRMLVPKKDIICTPYRVRVPYHKYAVTYKDQNNIKILPWDLVEITEGPAGLMMIHRSVFEKLMKDYPKLKIEFPKGSRALMNEEIGASSDAIDKYMYNFWDTSFKDQLWKGEDLAFCNLATEAGFKIYANLASQTTHHGPWGWTGTFGDSSTKKEEKQ